MRKDMLCSSHWSDIALSSHGPLRKRYSFTVPPFRFLQAPVSCRCISPITHLVRRFGSPTPLNHRSWPCPPRQTHIRLFDPSHTEILHRTMTGLALARVEQASRPEAEYLRSHRMDSMAHSCQAIASANRSGHNAGTGSSAP
jgi:hypothetical protein